ncbi:MAG TPA: c-type cytochrome [Burkholderiales bacterium]|jgi:cytochrome c553|nr:c-type cytochrome [Burkholderiales bacterium]
MIRAVAIAGCVVALLACTDREQPPAKPAAPKPAASQPAGDRKAGQILAEAECKSCHGQEGGGVAPGIPHLAGQREAYLLAAIKAYKEGKRSHAALKVIADHLSDADARNVSAYYAGLPPVGIAPAGNEVPHASPYERGKARAGECAKCHGVDGNSTTPGLPNLAGQQTRYLIIALQEYARGERKTSPKHAAMRALTPVEMESVAMFFASQTPAPRSAPPASDPSAGASLIAVCSGCHGAQGIAGDSTIPNLASQDFTYLVESIKAYRTTRKREKMQLYITGLSQADIHNVAAFYAVQKSTPSEKAQTLVRDLTEKCDRCHGAGVEVPGMPVPKIGGQDRDYLMMALRAYRDDRRESTTMHKMSLPYGDSIIESIASYYAAQRAK